jgi:hypothetical protein
VTVARAASRLATQLRRLEEQRDLAVAEIVAAEAAAAIPAEAAEAAEDFQCSAAVPAAEAFQCSAVVPVRRTRSHTAMGRPPGAVGPPHVCCRYEATYMVMKRRNGVGQFELHTFSFSGNAQRRTSLIKKHVIDDLMIQAPTAPTPRHPWFYEEWEEHHLSPLVGLPRRGQRVFVERAQQIEPTDQANVDIVWRTGFYGVIVVGLMYTVE